MLVAGMLAAVGAVLVWQAALLAHAYQPDGIVSPLFSLPFHQAAHYVERLAVYGIGVVQDDQHATAGNLT